MARRGLTYEEFAAAVLVMVVAENRRSEMAMDRGYPMAGTIKTEVAAAAADTLTERARRIEGVAAEVVQRAGAVLDRLRPAGQDKRPEVGGPTPPTSHALFALEATEQSLQMALALLRECAEALG